MILLFRLIRKRDKQESMGIHLNRELGFLAVHGFLHLLGYDHLTEEDEEKMFGKQDEILRFVWFREIMDIS